MADYKLVDAEKLDADLKNVADTIRKECGETHKLNFPEEFCINIEGISKNIQDMYTRRVLDKLYAPLSYVGAYAYAKMNQLQSVEFTEDATYIGECAFMGCERLLLERLPDSIYHIGNQAFKDCGLITLTKIPDKTTEIYRWAFSGCSKIQTMLMPEVTKIGADAFNGCSRLTEVTIKRKCEIIENTAFYSCNNLTTINVAWSEGEVANAPWGAVNATINYNYTGE